MWMRAGTVTGLCTLVVASGCSGSESAPPATPPHGLEIAIAPLKLPAVGVACYDLAVTTATDVVWVEGDPTLTRLGHVQADEPDAALAAATPYDTDTVCSDRFGNALTRGVTYIGTCDSSPEADAGEADGVQNIVTLWVDGLYNITKSAEIGGWKDPCPDGCSLLVDCNENEDSQVAFNLTIMRDAKQGFFDIAVNFENIFCSAKLDTCDASNDPITLLHGATADRDWTAVFGFACSAGTGDVETNLLYGDVSVVCGPRSFPIDPTAEEGTQSVTVGGETLHYGVYRGRESLTCDDPATEGVESCNKVYWNLAISLDDLNTIDNGNDGNSDGSGHCHLAFSATATDGDEGFANGLPTKKGVSYPYIDVDATLTPAMCQRHKLNDGGAVNTIYHGTLDGMTPPVAMCSHYDGAAAGPVAGAVCANTIAETCPCWAPGTDGAAAKAYLETRSDEHVVNVITSQSEDHDYVGFVTGVRDGDGMREDAVLVAGTATFSVFDQPGASGPFCVAARFVGEQTLATASQPISQGQLDACLATLRPTTEALCVGCAGSLCIYDGQVDYECPECTNNSQCGEGRVCAMDTLSCVGCVNDGDCTNGQVCETGSRTCVACVDDTQCAPGKVCDLAVFQCVDDPAAAVPCAGDVGPWSATTPLPSARSAFGLTTYNGWVYIAGGAGLGNVLLGDLHRAQLESDGTLGPWIPMGTIGTARQGLTLVAAADRLFIIGGNNDAAVHDMNEVLVAEIQPDGSIGALTQAAPLAAGHFFHTSLAYNGYLYAVGGFPTTDAQFARIANGTLETWQFTTPLSNGPRWVHSMVGFNEFLYVIGGDAGSRSDVLVTTMNPDGTLGAWSAARSLPVGHSFQGSAVSSGHLYVLGGSAPGVPTTNDVLFAPFQDQGASLGTFHAASNRFAFPRYANQSFASLGRLYVLGGNTDGTVDGVTTSVQMATIGTCGP